MRRRANEAAATAALGRRVPRALRLPDPEAPLFFSAETGEGAAELWRAIQEGQEGLERPARSIGSTPTGRRRREPPGRSRTEKP
jgi:hypothetical protein